MEHTMKPILSLSHLSKSYGHFQALHDLNLHITEGNIVGLFGVNGSGKSTLLKILASLLRQYQGEVEICGMPIGLHTKPLVSYLPDRNFLNPRFNALECKKFFADFFAFDSASADSMLELLQIPTNVPIKSLSKGTIEKLHLIFTLARRAKLYLLDEPIAGVDIIAREQVFSLITTYIPKDSAVLLATHLVNDAQPICTHALFIAQGRMLRYERKDTILESFDDLQSALKSDYHRAYSSLQPTQNTQDINTQNIQEQPSTSATKEI